MAPMREEVEPSRPRLGSVEGLLTLLFIVEAVLEQMDGGHRWSKAERRESERARCRPSPPWPSLASKEEVGCVPIV